MVNRAATLGATDMCRPMLAILALILGFSAATPSADARGTVREVMLLPHQNGVRIVLDLGLKVAFDHLTLDKPPRLIIDLPDVSWQLPERRGERSYRMVKGFRFGQLRDGVSRLVIDVDRPFEIAKVFELPPTDGSGYRIDTDILPLPRGAAMRQQRLSRTLVESETRSMPPLPRQRPRITGRDTDRPAQRAGLRRDPRSPEFVHIPMAKPSFSVAKRRIVVDPGHGGIDPGAIGKSGTREKDIVLAMALELRRQLVDTGRYDVILTRDDDSFVRLRDRLQIARAGVGDLFISLHTDSLVNATDVQGAAIYTLSDQASSEEAARLAAYENRADILGGIDLSHHEPIVTQILIDLAQRDANSKSLRFARLLVDRLSKVTKMLRKEQQQAGFVVLKSPDMPSTLIELGYLSNSKDERRLTDPDHVADLSGAIVDAIDRYFGGEPS